MARSETPNDRRIESVAVDAVRSIILKCDTLYPNLDENDKNILVDGTIEVYSSPELTKENLTGEVTVQVKGTTRKLRTNKRGFVKYSMDVVDLRRFLDVFHGVLLFCVAVGKDARPGQVYYSALHPYELTRILDGARDSQKTASVRVKPFPDDPREAKRLIIQFHCEHESQLKAEVTGYGFLDDKFELPPDITSFTFTSQLFRGESPISLAGLGDGPYVYGTTKDGLTRVIGKIGDVSMFGMGSEHTVSAGSFELSTMVTLGDQRDGAHIEFEGVSMTLSESNNKVSLTWSISGDFRRRYNTARFVQEFLRSSTFAIDSHSFLHIEQEQEEEETLQRLEETVNAYRPFVETLDALGIAVKWDPEKMTPKELNDLSFMHTLFVEKKPLEGIELKSPVVNFNIQGAQVYALARKREEGGYELFDILSDRLVFVFGYPDQKAVDANLGFDPVPALMALGEEEFTKVVNLKPDKFSEQLDRFPVTAGNQTPLNQKVLDMLSAYDKGAKQPHALLACATILARKLHEFDPDSQTYLLNLMQTLKRSRELEDEEKDLLRNLAIDTHERYAQAAAYVLLDDKDMAGRCFERCTKAERAQIENYPISLFFKDAGTTA